MYESLKAINPNKQNKKSILALNSINLRTERLTFCLDVNVCT